jgi:glycosyltransferase involved in cell wall biosynthesis
VASPHDATATPNKLSKSERWATWFWLAKLRLKEWVTCDSRVCRAAIGAAGVLAYYVLLAFGMPARAFAMLFRLHRGDLSRHAQLVAESRLRALSEARNRPLAEYLDRQSAAAQPTTGTVNFFEDPTRLLGNAILVVKSPRLEGNRVVEKGLLAVNYNHVLPLLVKFFDLSRIAERYHVFLEPSWSGFCTTEVLGFLRHNGPVFVGAFEPRDAKFLQAIQSNLVSVPLSTNWWVDHRLFHPTGVKKDIDVLMLAGWGEYKRHYRFFEALSRLRRQGHRLQVALMGYSVGWTKAEILRQARYFGILDQLEILENVPYERVNDVVNRAKIHVLWSRKEGVNRAIIECMFAGVPSIVREGFNYGYRYPYINDETGAFASEETLPQTMLDLIGRSLEMHPRAWVMENMSCERATQILSESLGTWCSQHGEQWAEVPALKVTQLHGMTYWFAHESHRFRGDYDWLNTSKR